MILHSQIHNDVTFEIEAIKAELERRRRPRWWKRRRRG